MNNITVIKDCKYRLPCGWCDRKNEMCQFETQAEAAKMLGIDPWHIHAALRGTKGGSRLLNSRGISFMLYEEYHNFVCGKSEI